MITWIPIYTQGDILTESKIGGTPWLNKSDEEPRCHLCNKLATFICQVNLETTPAPRHGMIQTFVCLYCASENPKLLTQPFSPIQMTRWVRPTGPSKHTFPYNFTFEASTITGWRSEKDFPVTLSPIPETKLFGFHVEEIYCPICQKPMASILQLKENFPGTGFISQCQAHPQIATFHGIPDSTTGFVIV